MHEARCAGTKNNISTGTISGCSNVAATGGGGKQVTTISKLTAVITWNAKKGTTTLKITYKAGTQGQQVRDGSTLIVATGSVTGGSGAALKAIPKGSKYSETSATTPSRTRASSPARR